MIRVFDANVIFRLHNKDELLQRYDKRGEVLRIAVASRLEVGFDGRRFYENETEVKPLMSGQRSRDLPPKVSIILSCKADEDRCGCCLV